MANITPNAAVTARIPIDVAEDALTDLIGRIESRLLRIVGHPSAERTEVVSTLWTDRALVSRPILSVASVGEGAPGTVPVETEDYFHYANGRTLIRQYYPWDQDVTITYTPVDITDDWIEAVIDLVRLRLGRQAMQGERTAEWSYTAPDWIEQEREIVARLLPPVVV